MKKLLLAHAIIEMIGGVVLIFRPDLFLMVPDQTAETLTVAKMYGIGAFTFGVVSYLLFKNFSFSDFYRRIILTIMAFHLMIAFQCYGAYTTEVIANLGAFGLHIGMAILFLIFYMNSAKEWDRSPE